LDVGCGAGRFAEVALSAGAIVVALDYSSAIDACRLNLGDHPNLHLVQGDIYRLPFARNSFPYVYSLGVLQHTPDVARAFAALPQMLQPDGQLAVDFYQRSWKTRFTPYYWLRPITRTVAKERLFSILQACVPTLLKVSGAIGRIPVAGAHLRRMVPVADYRGELPLDEKQREEWALLDTFDWLSPQYDDPQTPETVRAWLSQAGLEKIHVEKIGHLVGRGIAPA
jgi:SAM-dependent methyltransferase